MLPSHQQAMLVRGTKDNVTQSSRHLRLVPEAEHTQPHFRLRSDGIADVGALRIRAEADIRKCSYLPS
jgi:hypothetical protein